MEVTRTCEKLLPCASSLHIFESEQHFSMYAEIFDFAVNVAKEAGSMIREAYHKEKAITFKDTVDLVTETVFCFCAFTWYSTLG